MRPPAATSVKSSHPQAAAKEKDWQQHAARMIFGCSTQLSPGGKVDAFFVGRSTESYFGLPQKMDPKMRHWFIIMFRFELASLGSSPF